MLVRFGNVICNWDLSKGQMGLFGAPGEKKEVQQPGKLGGIFYRTEKGKVVYGQKPTPKPRKKKIEASGLLALFGSQPEKIKEHQKELQHNIEQESDAKKKIELTKQQAFTEMAEQNKKRLGKEKEPWEMTKKEFDAEVSNKPKTIITGRSRPNAYSASVAIGETKGGGRQPILDHPEGDAKSRVIRFGKYKTRIFTKDSEEFTKNPHKMFIQQAISEGKSVPEEVLKDYPELKQSDVKDKQEPQWKYEEYSDWSRQLARNNTQEELQKQLAKLKGEQVKNKASHLRAIDKTTSMQSNSQHRAQSGNVVRGNYERRSAIENALEVHKYYPEKAKGVNENKINKSFGAIYTFFDKRVSMSRKVA